MIELYKTDSITTIEDLKDFLTVIFVIVDDIYQEVTPVYIKNRRNSNYSLMSDIEIITVSLAGELISIDSGYNHDSFKVVDSMPIYAPL